MVLIGFTGKAGSGKTYSAQRMCMVFRMLGVDVPLISFATPIKRKARELYGDKPTRQQFQSVGDAMRAEDPNCIIRLAEQAAKESPSGIAVFDDGRLASELKFIKSCGFTVKVDTKDVIRAERLMQRDGHVLSESETKHITENEVDLVEPDFVLNNDRDIFEVDDQLWKFVRKFNLDDVSGGKYVEGRFGKESNTIRDQKA